MDPTDTRALAELRRRLAASERARDHLTAEVERGRELMDRTVRVASAEGLRPVAAEALDGVMAIVGARRGFVGLLEPGGGWSFVVARGHAGDLAEPGSQVSTTVIDQVLRDGEPVVTHDAAQELDAASVHRLALRSVACFPLRHGDASLGFVYLDDPGTEGLFDEAALAAVRAWCPLVAAAVARAAEGREAGVFPGVLTRSPRLRSVLEDLARIATFDAPILLTGETGTGKSLIARQVHGASPRRRGPFVHLNCGAIPVELMEGELFGAEVGAYTGAQARRLGKFEVAKGGTLFFDELDTMPPSCQVKLLVALQEKTITRLGGHAALPIDVRVVAAMSSDPFRAIAEGRLREDLYYRIAVFVTRIPPLRERPEDLPILARHVLARSSERYGVARHRLSAEAERTLLAHDWPGNVRELENTLDRAALLSRDGLIESLPLDLGRRSGEASASAPAGALARLQSAAEGLADEMVRREDLRDLELARALEGAVLVALARRLGSREAAFRLLGREDEVRSRNHHRTWSQRVGRLERLAEQLGEPLGDG